MQLEFFYIVKESGDVSNLLGSPTSGESAAQGALHRRLPFPIYWVPQRVGSREATPPEGRDVSFQFIGFPNEWGAILGIKGSRRAVCFQFIGFPNEWGV